MSFTINTNLGSLSAYNALAKTTAETTKAQLRLATMKKINSVADDTSGYNVGKKLEAQIFKQKAQLNNVSSAKNYLSTAETALQQINDKLNQISSKYIDSQDALKDQSSIADDIRTLAGEVDSILKNTNINGTNLLASTDGSSLTTSPTFDVGGTTFNADFAGDSYLKADTLSAALHGGPGSGVASYTGSAGDPIGPISPGNQTSVITATFADGSTTNLNVSTDLCTIKVDLVSAIMNSIESNPASGWNCSINFLGQTTVEASGSNNITSLTTTSGYDITGTLGITRSASGASGGLMDSNDSTVLTAAKNISTVADNVKASLGRIGNLSQTLDSRSDYLTSAIANNSATISGIFDADVAEEQLNATKGSITGQIGTTILAQMNSAPRNLLTLFS